MNSSNLGNASTQVRRKLVLGCVFALVSLACATFSFAAFAACPNGDDPNDANATPGVAAPAQAAITRNDRRINNTSLAQIISTLETNNLQFADATGNSVNFSALLVGQAFKIRADDTISSTTQTLGAKLLSKKIARITLPSTIQQQILFVNVKSPCLSTTTKTFLINIPGSATPQTAQCLSKNSGSVIVPGSAIRATIVFPLAPTI